MRIFPAVDIIGGKVVRLFNGDYAKVKTYGVEVERAALSFKASGAEFLHAVDLDGAKEGRAVNADCVSKLISSGLFVEVGGGIRTEEQIESYLAAGAGRVILGTVAVRNFRFTKRVLKKYAGKIAVGVDAVDGKVAVSGWREITDIGAFDFVKRLADEGAEYVIYTDISRDGALRGCNMQAYKELVNYGVKITASGGITMLEEIAQLKDIGVYAAVLGKALYEGKLNLKEVLAAAK